MGMERGSLFSILPHAQKDYLVSPTNAPGITRLPHVDVDSMGTRHLIPRMFKGACARIFLWGGGGGWQTRAKWDVDPPWVCISLSIPQLEERGFKTEA